MASLASINIRISVDMKQFSTDMQNSLRTVEKVGKQFQAVGRNLTTYVTLPILAAGAASLKFASDYTESLNKVEASFKGSSAQVKDFAKTSLETSGIAEGTALDMAAAFGDMATSMGLSTNQAAKMSTSLVSLAGDLASFKNIGIDQANTALTAIFTGETESLKKLGIVITEVNLKQYALNSGIKKNFDVMSQAEKVQLRYNYILSVTKNSQGDFQRTSGEAANQTRIFTESLKQVGQQLGAVVLPLFIKMITAVNDKIKAFSKLSEGTKTVIVVVAGLVAVVGPLLLAIGGILAVIPAVVAGFTLISASIVPILAGLAILLGVILIVKNAFSETAKAVVELSDSQKLIQKVTDEATSSIVDQKSQLELLLITARNENETKAERLKAIQAINRISPEYLGNLTLENINTDKARISIEKYNAALLSGATARAASRLLEENQASKIKAGFEREKALADYNEKRKNAIAKGWEAEKAFYEENNRLMQFANEALDRKNAKYDTEAKILTEIYNKNKANLELLTGDKTVKDKTAPVKEKKAKAPADISSLNIDIKEPISTGTAEAYDAEIAKLVRFRDEVAITAEQVKRANDLIKGVEFAKAINLDPSSLIKSVETTEEMMKRLVVSVRGAKESVSLEQLQMISNAQDFNAEFNDVWLNTIKSIAVGFGELVGQFAQGGLSIANIGNLFLTSLADMAIQVGKIAIETGVAVLAIKVALKSLNPYVAIAAGVALVALGTLAKSQLSNAGKTQAFANGGIVSGTSYYGDKILARVNSGEMIANSDQQKRIWNSMSAGSSVNVTVGGGFELDGNKLKLVLDRTDKRNSRVG
ncbi:hypothetical protein [Flavobacterium sp. FlaQc-28]|uniref:hypothetical protein n=1 Tax=Flavobacterium sp. FlaQc-28 TaxID=3374178 RepID=UPI003756647E